MYKFKQKDIDRFWKYVSKSAGCWLWEKSLTKTGYGRFNLKGKAIRAHRFSFFLLNKDITEKDIICHHCDNPACVNPAHLWKGTNKENTQDMIRKGRLVRSHAKHKTAASKYYGVYYRKENKKWRSVYCIKYTNYRLGQFNTEMEAALAYDKAVKEINLHLPDNEKKHVNFP